MVSPAFADTKPAPATSPEASRLAPSYGKEHHGQLEYVGKTFGLLLAANPAAREAGINENEIGDEIRRYFKDQGIQVHRKFTVPLITVSYSAKEVQKAQGRPIYALSVELTAKEPALTMNRRPNVSIVATLWSRSSIGIMQGGSRQMALEATKALVELFASDLRKANRAGE